MKKITKKVFLLYFQLGLLTVPLVISSCSSNKEPNDNASKKTIEGFQFGNNEGNKDNSQDPKITNPLWQDKPRQNNVGNENNSYGYNSSSPLSNNGDNNNLYNATNQDWITKFKYDQRQKEINFLENNVTSNVFYAPFDIVKSQNYWVDPRNGSIFNSKKRELILKDNARTQVKKIYQGKNDKVYYDEDAAKLSYYSIGSGYYYNGIFFQTKNDIKKYLSEKKIDLSSEKFIVLKGKNGTISQTLNIKKLQENDENEIAKLFYFVTNNIETSYTVINPKTNEKAYFDQNDEELIEKLLKNLENIGVKFDYTKINSSKNESQYFVDNHRDDNNNVFGPLFYVGSSDIKNFTNKDEWEKFENNFPVNREHRATLASGFFDFIIPELDFDAEDELFSDHKDKMLFYFPYDTSDPEYDLENLVLNDTWLSLVLDIESEKPYVLKKLIDLSTKFKESKRFSSFYKIPTYYFFLLDKLIEAGASEKLIISLKNFFKMVGDKVNRHLSFLNDQIFKNSTFDMLSPKLSKNQKEKFDFNEYFRIGKNELDISSNISTYLNNIYDQYPNLAVVMSIVAASEQFASAAPGLQINFDLFKEPLRKLSIDFDEANILKNWKYIDVLWNLLTTTSISQAAIILNLNDSVFKNIKEGSENHQITSVLHNLFDIKWIRNKITLKNVSNTIVREIKEFLNSESYNKEKDFLGNLKNYPEYLRLLQSAPLISFANITVLNNLVAQLETGNKSLIKSKIKEYINFILNSDGARTFAYTLADILKTNRSSGPSLFNDYKDYTSYTTHYILNDSIDNSINSSIIQNSSNIISGSLNLNSKYDEKIDFYLLGSNFSSGRKKNDSLDNWMKEFFESQEGRDIRLSNAINDFLVTSNPGFSPQLGFDMNSWFEKQYSKVLSWVEKNAKRIYKNKNSYELLVVAPNDSSESLNAFKLKNPDITSLSSFELIEIKNSFISRVFDRVKNLSNKVVEYAFNNKKDINPEINKLTNRFKTKIQSVIKNSPKGHDAIFNSSINMSVSNIDQIIGSKLNSTIDSIILKKQKTNKNNTDLDEFINEIFSFLEKEKVEFSIEKGVEETLKNNNKNKLKNNKLNIKTWINKKIKDISEKLDNNPTIFDKLWISSVKGTFNLVKDREKFEKKYSDSAELLRKAHTYEKEQIKTSLISKISNRLEKIANRIYNKINSKQSFNIEPEINLEITKAARRIESKIKTTKSNASLPNALNDNVIKFIKNNKTTNIKDFNTNFDAFFKDLVTSINEDDVDLNLRDAIDKTLSDKNIKKLSNSSSLNIKKWFKDKRKAISNYIDGSSFLDNLKIKKSQRYNFEKNSLIYSEDSNDISSGIYRKLTGEEKSRIKSSIISKTYKQFQKLSDEVYLSLSSNKNAKKWQKHPNLDMVDTVAQSVNSNINLKDNISLPKNGANVLMTNSKPASGSISENSGSDSPKFNSKNTLTFNSKEKLASHQQIHFTIATNIVNTLTIAPNVALTVLKLLQSANSDSSSLDVIKQLGNGSFELSSQIISLASSSLLLTHIIGKESAKLASVLTKLNYSFLAVSWAIEIAKFFFDALIPEEKRFVYTFSTDNKINYIWDGGYLKTNWFGFNVLEETTLEDAQLLKPLEIISPKNRDFIYFDGKKYDTTELDTLKKEQLQKIINNEYHNEINDFLGKEYIFKYDGSARNDFLASDSLIDIFKQIYSDIVTRPETSNLIYSIFSETDLGSSWSTEETKRLFIEKEIKKAKKTYYVKLPKLNEEGYVFDPNDQSNSLDTKIEHPSDLVLDSTTNKINLGNINNDIFIIYDPTKINFDKNGNISKTEFLKLEENLKSLFKNSFNIKERINVGKFQRDFSKFDELVEITLYYLKNDKTTIFTSHSALLDYEFLKKR